MSATLALILLLQSPKNTTDELLIRKQESTLVHALSAADKKGLLQLTDDGMTFTLQCGSGVNFSRINIRRTSWIKDVSRLRITKYETHPLEISFSNHEGKPTNSRFAYDKLATLRAAESIGLVTENGYIEKDLFVVDTWAKAQGTWKLVNRMYFPKECQDGPNLKFP